MFVCLSVMCVNFLLFTKDFSGTTALRILNFGTSIGYDLYCVRQNQHPHAYHTLYLSFFFFFFFFFSPIKFFIKDFSETTAPRILKFHINIGYNFLYRLRENQHLHAYHSAYLSFFSHKNPSQISHLLLEPVFKILYTP